MRSLVVALTAVFLPLLAMEAAAGRTEGKSPDKTLCLPVIADKCGCVYSCGVGRPAGKDKWKVRHPDWKGMALEARVDTWCVAKKCTRAFFAQILCTVICGPRPADPTCHFEGDRCLGRTR